jgi:hypothetical protein
MASQIHICLWIDLHYIEQKMKKFLLLIVAFYMIQDIKAQVKIGTNPASLNTNSLLELESSGKGLLLPRSTTAQINSMSNVPVGMLIFNTTDSALYIKRASGWMLIQVSKTDANPTLRAPAYADFYAMIPGDIVTTIAPGMAVPFPQTATARGIFRLGPSSFWLEEAGDYKISFVVSIIEPGQLVVVMNGTELPYTVAGRGTGQTQITGTYIITAIAGSILEIRNPQSGFMAYTVSPNAGGPQAVSAHLVIQRLD